MVLEQKEEVGVGNPLAPLTAEEIAAAVETVRKERGLKESAKFVSVELYEPSKEAVLAGTVGLPREAFMVIRERADSIKTKIAARSLTLTEAHRYLCSALYSADRPPGGADCSISRSSDLVD